MKPPQIVRLDSPRELADDERVLLDFLLTSPLAHDEIKEQAATAKVVAVCDCGCRSIVLEAAPDTPTATFSLDEATYPGRTDAIQIQAWGRSETGRIVDVTLNVIDGRISELEIWDGLMPGQNGTRGEGPQPGTLGWNLPE
jgi:hypothetical protein